MVIFWFGFGRAKVKKDFDIYHTKRFFYRIFDKR